MVANDTEWSVRVGVGVESRCFVVDVGHENSISSSEIMSESKSTALFATNAIDVRSSDAETEPTELVGVATSASGEGDDVRAV